MSLRLEHVTYLYDPEVPDPVRAVNDVTLEIPDHQFIAVIGHTGSGKSTLIQHLNGLLKPTSGKIFYNGEDIWQPGYNLRKLRSEVGLVFQYPEHQLFEETVLKDVCFGPKNQGLSEEEAEKKAKEALVMTGMKEELWQCSPFELSGGQKRRAAIAGVLAMDPKILILDEPTAGLDPLGRDEILDQVSALRKEKGITVVLVSHSMEDVAKYAERLIVIDRGSVQFDDIPRAVFCHYLELEKMGLAAPQVTYLAQALKEKGVSIPLDVTTPKEAADAILRWLQKQSGKEKGAC